MYQSGIIHPMCERYDQGIKAYVRNIGSAEQALSINKTAEFVHGDVKLSGILIENSLIIPFSDAYGRNDMLSKMVESNIKILKEKAPEEPIEVAACHLIGLPFNGQTNGLRSNGEGFGFIAGIHFYPDDEVLNGDNFDFIKFTQEVLATKGTTLTIIKSA